MKPTTALAIRCFTWASLLFFLFTRLVGMRRAIALQPDPQSRFHGASFPPEFLHPGFAVIAMQNLCVLLLLLYALDVASLLLPRSRRPSRLVVNLCQLAMFGVLLWNTELLMRDLADPWIETVEARPDADVFWSLNPRYRLKGYEANQYGFRGPDFPLDKMPGEFRILCLGDSISTGLSLEERKTYPAKLRALLQKRFPARRIRVLNGAVYGYTAYQQLFVLENMLPLFKPDLVIAEVSGYFARTSNEEASVRRQFPAVQIRRLLFSSVLYLYLRQALAGTVGELGAKPFIEWKDEAEKQRDDEFFTRGVRGICERCRAAGLPLLFYIPYRSNETTGKFPEIIRQVLSEYSVPKVDMLKTWAARPDVGELVFDDCHPTDAGSTQQTAEIAGFIIAQGLIKP